MKLFYALPLLACVCLTITNCSTGSSSGSGTSAVEDSSASGAVASSIGGALGGSSSTGTVSMSVRKPQTVASLFSSVAHAEAEVGALGACPTIASGCTQATAAEANMVYNACSFGGSGAVWTGTMQATITSPSANVTCGTFPTINAGTLNRQFVTSGAPGGATRVSAGGVAVNIDDSSANLNNFDKANTTISANIGTGYGSQVVFSGGKRTAVDVSERLYSSSFDHSITGSVSLSEANGTRTITGGSMTVYHNLLRIVGTTTFSNVTYNDTCCTPISGTITTAYASAGSAPHVQPTQAGALLVGASEVLQITGCGTGTLTVAGLTTSVMLRGCY